MSRITASPCTCPEHAQGPVLISEGGHLYSPDESDSEGWRWLCSCGAKGRLNYQGPGVAYHGWLRHLERTR